jgi:hypothetical protein
LGGVNIKAAILQKQVELQMDNLELFALKDFSWLDIKADKITQYKQGDQFKHPDYATAAQMGFIGTADDLEMAKQADAESEPATAQDDAALAHADATVTGLPDGDAALAGADDAVDYNKMTVPALQAFLEGSGVKCPSDALKGDLVALAQKVK